MCNSSLGCILNGTAELFDRFSDAARRFGLTVSLKNTEVMLQPSSHQHYTSPSIKAGNVELKVVDKFRYLGSVLSSNATVGDDISATLSKANVASVVQSWHFHCNQSGCLHGYDIDISAICPVSASYPTAGPVSHAVPKKDSTHQVARSHTKYHRTHDLQYQWNRGIPADCTTSLVWARHPYAGLTHSQAGYLWTTPPWLPASWWTVQTLQGPSEGYAEPMWHHTISSGNADE